ncbi:MAG: transposase, partial [Geminicoccaceae bacterium]|nr:transposase [Geminicoccaceae bacterium]
MRVQASADELVVLVYDSVVETVSGPATEFALAMSGNMPLFPELSPVDGKPVRVAFDGGRLTSDAGVLVLAEIERRLNIAGRLAGCIEDPRRPDRIVHDLASMIRFRALMIAA